MILTDEETKALYDYFMNRAGYIDYKDDYIVIQLVKRLEHYILVTSQPKEEE